MNIPKAIEILQTEHDTSYPHSEPDFYQALTLGIEALKMIELSRNLFKCPGQAPLPGETEGD